MGRVHDDDYGQRAREIQVLRERYEDELRRTERDWHEERTRWREAFHAYDGLDDEPAREPVDEAAYLAAEFAAGLDE